MKKLIAIVTGHRKWKKESAVYRELYKRRKKLILVIEGGAPGADTHANTGAKLLKIPTATFEANWGSLGLAAGPIRNTSMLKFGTAMARALKVKLIVLAFHKNLKESKGTKNMVGQARKKKVLVKVFSK